ncbi:MAG: bifunctional demethylmenaquinone methyltransferase/2-methoxy-6-polyprenyl-1,4-benzoquinol methylase UbiE [bacterium]|nr:bifunctional demethylmenaquinone methyltransferase/2-methoxy-6-polyprenyl-1,4-benzoquinol methylase UbiE [bacterium]
MAYSLPTRQDKPAYVQAMFDRIAGHYDQVNDWMTFGRHRAWKRQLVRLAGARAGGAYLDLCTGTGDIAALWAEHAAPGGTVEALDFSPGMLEIARKRHPVGAGVHWIQGDATALPFPDASFDAVSVGFGLRNVVDLEAALMEALRVLRPGGMFISLETGKPAIGFFRLGNALYGRFLVPMLGRLMSGDREAYRYLPTSSEAFPDQRELARRFEAVGFEGVRVHDRMFGAVALVAGLRPRA